MHERAVEYFRRALRLCGTYLSAWTLMGHEYVDLKNAPAAIGAALFLLCLLVSPSAAYVALPLQPDEPAPLNTQHAPYTHIKHPLPKTTPKNHNKDSYRRAVDLCGRDYRAWYGLGQTYEMLKMPYYALHYYR